MIYNPQLDTFICVVEAGSFSKAAEKLYISAPAVIKQINSIDDNLKVKDVSTILPWYSEVNTDKTVEIVNYMKDQVMRGNQIFYSIYSEEEMNADPAKRDLNLRLWRGDMIQTACLDLLITKWRAIFRFWKEKAMSIINKPVRSIHTMDFGFSGMHM